MLDSGSFEATIFIIVFDLIFIIIGTSFVASHGFRFIVFLIQDVIIVLIIIRDVVSILVFIIIVWELKIDVLGFLSCVFKFLFSSSHVDFFLLFDYAVLGDVFDVL